MNTKEVANIIIALRKRGWSEEEINDFMVFVETNTPSAKEADEAKKERDKEKS